MAVGAPTRAAGSAACSAVASCA